MTVSPYNEAWSERPLTLQEVLEEPIEVKVCPDCRLRGCVRVYGADDHGPFFESESCETCHGWGAVRVSP